MRSSSVNQLPSPSGPDAGNGVASPDDLAGLPADDVSAAKAFHADLPRSVVAADPYAMIRQALRGRYFLFVVLVLLGAGLGVFGAWKMGRPVYQSTAQVRVAYAIAPVAVETDQNKWLGPYDTIMRSQEQVITSRPIVEKALSDEQWQALGRHASAADVREFQKDLTAQRVGVTEHIRVGYTHEDPAVAATGVNAVVRAYVAAHEAKVRQFERDRRAKLQHEAKEFRDKIAELETRVRTTSQEFGVPDVEIVYTNTERRVALLEAKTIEVQAMLSSLRHGQRPLVIPPAATEAGNANAPAFKPLTPIEIANGGDLVMRQFLAEEARVSEDIDAAINVRRLLEGHQEVKLLRQRQRQAADRVDAAAAEYNRTQALLARYSGGAGPIDPSAPGQPAVAVEVINADLATFNRLLDESKDKLSALAPKRKEVQLVKTHADQLRTELSKLEGRQSVLDLEFLPQGRVEVIEPGDVPEAPFYDVRKKYAAVGAVLGAGIPAGLVVLFGLRHRRYRYSDEAETQLAGSAPLLGILPSLPSRMIDPEQASSAAQCVHQIRVMLQVSGGASRQRRTVYLLTSATPGEGKTSFAVSLGLSFAAAGSRALVIDCDLIGQRLTRGFNLAGVPGLLEALSAGTVRGFARKTATGLWVLPVGTADVLDACAVSSSQMKRLLAEARRYFDTILIDSGPILGSVEATTVAPQADGVIFTVSRGQQPLLVEKALRHLDSIGAPVAGFVFNRAAAKDFSRSAHASSLRSIPVDAPARTLMSDNELASRFGPLVQSVVSLLPAARDWVEPGQVAPKAQETAAVGADA